MIRRILDDPWRVLQAYALLLAFVLLVAGVAHVASTADEWTDDGRPVVVMSR